MRVGKIIDNESDFDERGIDAKKLMLLKRLKNMSRGRISDYLDKYSQAVFTPVDYTLKYNPICAVDWWNCSCQHN